MTGFAVPYRIRFDDTMAYGTHHFLTGFKFQCAAREALLFGAVVDAVPGARAALDQVHLLTIDAYNRNLGSAGLGDRLAVLATVEDRGRTAVTFCFRVVRADGTPIACGFQTVACADPATGAIRPYPDLLLARFDALAALDEPTADADATFRARVLRGGRATRSLFPPGVIAAARAFLTEDRLPAAVRLDGLDGVDDVDGSEAPVAPGEARAAGPGRAPDPRPQPDARDGTDGWVFSGQGTFDPALFAARARLHPGERAVVAAVVRDRLGIDAGPLWDAPDAIEPDLEQVGILVQNVWGAGDAGPAPGVLLGHSFGELAAVTVAGCVDLAGG
ncbi:MAG: polyketide synthase, partial [Myxococcota bacterium]